MIKDKNALKKFGYCKIYQVQYNSNYYFCIKERIIDIQMINNNILYIE